MRPHLTHWGRVTHICDSKLTIIGSANGLSPGRRQSIIWTNGGILSIGLVGTRFSEILIEIHILSLKKCMWNCRLRNGGHFVSVSMFQGDIWQTPLFFHNISSSVMLLYAPHAVCPIKYAHIFCAWFCGGFIISSKRIHVLSQPQIWVDLLARGTIAWIPGIILVWARPMREGAT